MDNTALQAQLADYVSACAFATFDHPGHSAKVQIFTIDTPKAFSKPVIEISRALEISLAEITEVDEVGSVQDLKVKNRSDKYLLIYEGTLLKGAKQNRVVNATLLLPPLSSFVIPASCVEQGRWRHSSPRFESSAYNAPQFLRKSIRSSISSSRDLKGRQAKVWDDISHYSFEAKLSSPSSDFEDIYHRSDKKQSIFPQGLPLPAVTGIFLQAAGEWSLDFVANEAAFASLLPRLLPGYEFPAMERPASLPDKPGQALADWILQGQCFSQPSAAAGTDVRIETPQGHFSALITEGEVVSLSMMAN
jgi:hypothetical protein